MPQQVAQFRKKPALVEAIQWFRNGDHPADNSTPINRPGGHSTTLTEGEVVRHFHGGIPGDRVCTECGNIMHRHGIIVGLNGEEETVHPGDYILTDSKGRYYRRSQKDFEANFEPYDPDEIKDEVDLAARVRALEERLDALPTPNEMVQ